jgi:hypothetical protein
MSQVTASEWHPLGRGSLGRLATFYPDGRYSILGMEFDQDTSFQNTRLGSLELNKAPGTAATLSIVTPNTTHLLYYGFDQMWWHKDEVKKGFLARLFGL